jgi:hypothetical protein
MLFRLGEAYAYIITSYTIAYSIGLVFLYVVRTRMLKAVTFDLWGTLIQERQEGLHRAKDERIRSFLHRLKWNEFCFSGEGSAIKS